MNQLLPVKEHVLGAAQTDSLCAEGKGLCGIGRLVGVGTDVEALEAAPLGCVADLVAPAQECAELGRDSSLLQGQLTSIDTTGGAVNSDEVPLLEGGAADGNFPALYHHFLGTADTGRSHTTGYNGGVAGHSTSGGQDSLGAGHSGNVLRAGLLADQDNLLALTHPLLRLVGGVDNLSAGGTRRGVEALGELLGRLEGSGVNHGVQQLVDVGGRHTKHGLLTGDEPLLHHVHGTLDG